MSHKTSTSASLIQMSMGFLNGILVSDVRSVVTQAQDISKYPSCDFFELLHLLKRQLLSVAKQDCRVTEVL